MEKPTLQLCTRRKEKEEEQLSHRSVKITPSLYSFEAGRQHLPETYTKVNGLKPGKMILLDKSGVSYEMKLKLRRNEGYSYIKDKVQWKKFCLANEVTAGETFILELTEQCELKFFSKVLNETERTGSLSERLNENEPNLVQEVLTSERHQTSEFRSACPEEEHEHSGHSSPQLVLQPTPPPRQRVDKDVVLTNRSTRDWCSTLRKRKKMPSSRFKALRMNKQCFSPDCVALVLYLAVSDQEPTGDVQDTVGREAQYTPVFSNDDDIPSPPPRYPHLRTDVTTLHFLESSGNTSTASQDSSDCLKGRTTRAKYLKKRSVSTPTSADPHITGQGAVSDQNSLLIAEVQRRRAELYEQFKIKQDDLEAEHTAKNSECTSSFRLLFSDPFQLELEKFEIRKNYEEEDSLLIAELQRRSAEVDEEFKRKHDDIEAEYTAKSSQHT